ncbi:oxygen-insensitive NAD(P)H-dependent nitroreductase NfsB [Thiosulfatimonas sediminis]|uniref:Oxygen-insensitive NAD(P)H-dependent nitroreductase NfsB n=1 Tax=Thiosulfatimonas sediminis TaxID=2675054 RepID=A0A6F8PUJ6_9GAMM|nr:oxygen-insensitive NAD(P)H nitroreductase [Thiosulfatimonas sediminis]BBP45795.1 oxygen-insensitive NAD(P)H-dependent nitroreductase NfsB [Thiosulfatimonas sediminis]
MNILEIAQSRYATKKFNPNKRISDQDFAQIKGLLRFSPSSVNSQPWHFFIADNRAAKQRLSLATQPPYAANEAKILDASHVILFCAKNEIDQVYLQKICDQEEQDGRFATPEAKAMALQVRSFYADLHRVTLQDTPAWLQKQVYLNLGTVLLGAASLGIDAVPIEGVDLTQLEAEFALPEKGLTAVALVALGYHAADDFNADLPKSRFPASEIMTFL